MDGKIKNKDRIAALEAEVALLSAKLDGLRAELAYRRHTPPYTSPWWEQWQSEPLKITCGSGSVSTEYDPRVLVRNGWTANDDFTYTVGAG